MTQRDYAPREAEDPHTDVASTADASKATGEFDASPSVCVVETVADALGTEPNDLRPLYDVIDPDALDLFFESPHRPTSGRVTFTFEGCAVAVDADGRVTASPGADDEE